MWLSDFLWGSDWGEKLTVFAFIGLIIYSVFKHLTKRSRNDKS